MQCCPRASRQHCIRKHLVQFWLNILGTTLHRSKPYTILFQRLQTTLHRKKSRQCGLNNIWSLRLHKYIRSFKSKGNIKLSFLYYGNRLISYPRLKQQIGILPSNLSKFYPDTTQTSKTFETHAILSRNSVVMCGRSQRFLILS